MSQYCKWIVFWPKYWSGHGLTGLSSSPSPEVMHVLTGTGHKLATSQLSRNEASYNKTWMIQWEFALVSTSELHYQRVQFSPAMRHNQVMGLTLQHCFCWTSRCVVASLSNRVVKCAPLNRLYHHFHWSHRPLTPTWKILPTSLNSRESTCRTNLPLLDTSIDNTAETCYTHHTILPTSLCHTLH